MFGGLFLVACDSTGPGLAECASFTPVVLGVGEHTVIEPQPGHCVSLPAAAGSGAEHVYLPVATEGQETENGVSAPYAIRGTGSAPAAAAAHRSRLPAFQARRPSDAFHSMLRARERDLSQRSALQELGRSRMGTAAPPPVVGDQRTFDVCATTACLTFVQSTATVKAVGNRVAVYVDNAAPASGYTDADLVDVAALFDDHLYPIDTLAFGRESDIDGNGVVVVLLTQRVNALSPDCNATESVILGYFFGADLLPRGPGNTGSNEAEIFYGLVPDPDNPDCSVTETFALSRLPSTFVHEFQHMISFNQHRLVRGASAEDTWLNEGLSHFAEELAGRKVPDSECPVSGSCADDFLAQGNLVNAFAYLGSPEDFFLIEPESSSGELEERGANWLFVRWLLDHFATDSVFGTDLTQRLVATSLVGVANVAAQTAVGFSTLVAEWQLANYLDDLPGFSQPSARLRYKSWNFREVAEANSRPYPLVPDSTAGPGYSHVGVLRAGSGKHVLVLQAAGAGPVDLLLWGGLGEPFPSVVDARVAVVRIR
ncbi:MAG TPA: hypothetical protein VFS51_09695 [Gemmatimonadales bacterium]|nr:hypothetical protein [Gemmatimonadales bacterium]